MTVARAHAARRDARHQRRLRRRARRARRHASTCTPGEVIGLVGGNGAGKSTLMRVLSGAHPADSGEILVDGKPVTIRNPRDAKALQHRDDLPDARPRRQHRRAGQPVPRPRADDPPRLARRLEHGGRDAQDHGPPEPELHALRAAREVAVGRPAPGRGHRPRGLLQRPDPDHGRAHRGARAGRDRPGPQPRPPAQGRGHRDLPHQPRHPRRLRPVRPDQRHVPRPDRRHGRQGRRDAGRRARA